MDLEKLSSENISDIALFFSSSMAVDHQIAEDIQKGKIVDGKAFIDSLQQIYPELKELYEGDAQVSEEYTVEEHTKRVLDVFETQKQFWLPGVEVQGIDNIEQFMRVIICLHDIGKSKGPSRDQHIHTLPILEKYLAKWGYSEDAVNLAKALVGHDYIGELIRPRFNLTAQLTYPKLSNAAQQVGVELSVFSKLQQLLYFSDAPSYPGLRDAYFITNSAGLIELKDFEGSSAEKLSELQELVNATPSDLTKREDVQRFVEIDPLKKADFEAVLPQLKRNWWIMKSDLYFCRSVKVPNTYENFSGWNVCSLYAKLSTKKGFSPAEANQVVIQAGEALTKEEAYADQVLSQMKRTLKHACPAESFKKVQESGELLSVLERGRRGHNINNRRTTDMEGKDDSILFTWGSPQHPIVKFMDETRSYTVIIDYSGFESGSGKPAGSLKGLMVGEHIYPFMTQREYVEFFGDTKRVIRYEGGIADDGRLGGYKETTYYRADGTILKRKDPSGSLSFRGSAIIPGTTANFWLELRFIGGSYRQSILDNPTPERLAAAYDSIYNPRYFEAWLPQEFPLSEKDIAAQRISIIEPRKMPAHITDETIKSYHAAVEAGEIDKVAKFLSEGMPVDAKYLCERGAALVKAVKGKHYELARLLIEAGADITFDDEEGESPINYAVEDGAVDFVQFLVSYHHQTKVDAQVSYAIDFYHPDKEGYTPLERAAMKGFVSVVNILLNAGVNPNGDHNHFGFNTGIGAALVLAIRDGNHEVASKLIEAGASINGLGSLLPKNIDVSPLMVAASNGNKNLLEELLRRGADVAMQARDLETGELEGRTALFFALKYPECFYLLAKQAGADLKQCDSNGMSLLDVLDDINGLDDDSKNELIAYLESQGVLRSELGLDFAKVSFIDQNVFLARNSRGQPVVLLGINESDENTEYSLIQTDYQDYGMSAAQAGLSFIGKVNHGASCNLMDSFELRIGDKDMQLKFGVDEIDKVYGNIKKSYPDGEIVSGYRCTYNIFDVGTLKGFALPSSGGTYSSLRWFTFEDLTSSEYKISNYATPILHTLIANQTGKVSDEGKAMVYRDLNSILSEVVNLSNAIFDKDVERVRELASNFQGDVKDINDAGLSFLAMALLFGNSQILEVLLRNGFYFESNAKIKIKLSNGYWTRSNAMDSFRGNCTEDVLDAALSNPKNHDFLFKTNDFWKEIANHYPSSSLFKFLNIALKKINIPGVKDSILRFIEAFDSGLCGVSDDIINLLLSANLGVASEERLKKVQERRKNPL